MNMNDVVKVCLSEKTKNPIVILRKLMELPLCHMHGPEHHTLVGSALLTAYKNAGGDVELEKALYELDSRAKNVPGGACGFWGACGACVSSGMFVSVVTKATPLSQTEWSLPLYMTSKSLDAIADIGGPRCCKRNSYTSIIEAVEFAKTNLNVNMELSDFSCIHSKLNAQCIKERCPYYKSEV